MAGEPTTVDVVITGGGTAGHVLPAIAVADALVAAGHSPSAIHYVGAQRGVETELLPDTPYSHTFFDVVGFQRSITRRNLGFVPKMVAARRAAVALLRQLQPGVVVSVGGYASMPAVFAAHRLGIPVVVVSFDMRPGRASELSARRAAACAVAFPNSPLPRATMTGAPVRQSVLAVDRETGRSQARARLGVDDDRFLVAVTGGSLGSKLLNDAIVAYVADRSDDARLAVRHAVGKRWVETIAAQDQRPDGVHHEVIGFEPDMPTVLAAADLLIGRGGASTVHEVAVTGIPAILVPWAGSAEDHQTLNVRWLSDQGGAVLLSEAEVAASPSALGAEIERLRADEAARQALSVAASAAGQVHRSGALAALIDEVLAAPPASPASTPASTPASGPAGTPASAPANAVRAARSAMVDGFGRVGASLRARRSGSMNDDGHR